MSGAVPAEDVREDRAQIAAAHGARHIGWFTCVPTGFASARKPSRVTQRAPIQSVENDRVHIAYEVVGEDERDLILVQGFMSHLDLEWENPALVRLFQGLNTSGA